MSNNKLAIEAYNKAKKQGKCGLLYEEGVTIFFSKAYLKEKLLQDEDVISIYMAFDEIESGEDGGELH